MHNYITRSKAYIVHKLCNGISPFPSAMLTSHGVYSLHDSINSSNNHMVTVDMDPVYNGHTSHVTLQVAQTTFGQD